MDIFLRPWDDVYVFVSGYDAESVGRYHLSVAFAAGSAINQGVLMVVCVMMLIGVRVSCSGCFSFKVGECCV